MRFPLCLSLLGLILTHLISIPNDTHLRFDLTTDFANTSDSCDNCPYRGSGR